MNDGSQDSASEYFRLALQEAVEKQWRGFSTVLANNAGLSRSLITDILKGRTSGSVMTRQALAMALGVSYEEMLETGRNLHETERGVDDIDFFNIKPRSMAGAYRSFTRSKIQKKSSPQPPIKIMQASLEPDSFLTVPVRYASAAMGGGSYEGSRQIKGYIAFREAWLTTKGDPDKMSALMAFGTSMEPTIPDGSMVLVDESQTTVVDGRVYFFALAGALYIKRLRLDGGRLFVESDNTVLGVQAVGEQDNLKVFGRVIWYASEL